MLNKGNPSKGVLVTLTRGTFVYVKACRYIKFGQCKTPTVHCRLQTEAGIHNAHIIYRELTLPVNWLTGEYIQANPGADTAKGSEIRTP